MIVFFRTYIEYEEPAGVVDKDCEKNTKTLSKQCPCNDGYEPDFPFQLTPQSMLEEFRSLKGVQPIATGSRNPLLNGQITDLERQVSDWDDEKMYLNPIAVIDHHQQLSVLKAIKEGKLPYLTLHNLSLILEDTPCLSRFSLFCIFCGVRCSKIETLLSHIQKFHTGFVATCQICGLHFASERSAYDHAKNAHDYLGGFKKSCTKSRHCYNQEALTVGHAIAGLKMSNIPHDQWGRKFNREGSLNNCCSNNNESDKSAAKILKTLSAETNGMSEEEREKKKKALFLSMMNKNLHKFC
ncbi:uncharacterized protein LOC141852174 [Brevipalpus obovatus]|uniref:uncharacterized protein LOC141852174 n=1 Tax=Brevipalpus obovatus TaxID=246614 RepID=UPI003D9EB20E